jgi:hypothetical protein
VNGRDIPIYLDEFKSALAALLGNEFIVDL